MWLWIILAAAVLVVIIELIVIIRAKRPPKNFAGSDVYRSLLGTQPASAPVAADPKLEPLRQNLRVKLLHQEDKIDAAIALERDRNPAGTDEDWHKAAIARWERENQ